ncbi:MAG: DUF4190 domain-containing protein [Candidatus Pacearchaeota archaeon]
MAASKSKTKESHPLTSYTLGVLSVATSFSLSPLGLVLGIIGLVKNKNKGIEHEHTSKVLNITGIVLGAIGTALFIISLIGAAGALTGQAVTQPPSGL